MRITRHKALKKALRFYKAAFDFVDPYHVIAHPSFIDAAVAGELRLKEDLSYVLDGRVTPMVTECVMAFLRKNGRTNTPSLLVGKACYRLKCGHHDKTPLSPSECILSQLGKENIRHFFVATQDDELKSSARRVAGTPVLCMHSNTVMMESPSDESRTVAEHRETKRRLPKLSEIHTEPEEQDAESNNAADAMTKKKPTKQKKKRGVNPLSCKPPKKSVVPVVAVIEKKKRVRNRKNKVLQVSE